MSRVRSTKRQDESVPVIDQLVVVAPVELEPGLPVWLVVGYREVV